REQYEEVILIHNEVKTVHDNRNILLKAQVLALKSYYRLERFGEATAFLNDIMNELYLYNKREDISKIFQYELATFARFNETADLQEEIDLLKGKLDINFDFIWFKHYFYYKKDYKEALKYISKIYDENQHFFIYYLITLDKLGKE